jgi:hypothetical protein
MKVHILKCCECGEAHGVEIQDPDDVPVACEECGGLLSPANPDEFSKALAEARKLSAE